MRSVALFLELLVLLPIAFTRPFVGVLLWSWISFMNPHRLVYGFAGDLPWALVTFAFTMIGCLLAREPKRLPINAVTISIVLFLLMISLTTMFALAPWADVETKWASVFKVFLFLLVTAALLTDKDRIHALIWVMTISLAYYGIKGGAFTLLGGGGDRVLGPPSSIIGDNNHLATALIVSMPLMNYLRMQSRHAIIRYGFVAAMVLTLFAVVGSWSRGAFVALGAVVFYFWLKSPRKLVSGALLIIALSCSLAFMPERWVERMQTIQHYQADSSAEARFQVWHTAWVMATTRPLTGAGFFATYSQPVVDRFVPHAASRAVHSIWLEVLGEHGFPTFFVWLSIIVAGAFYTRSIIKRAKGVPGLEWCLNLARMARVSTIAYVTGGSFLSLSYWDYYFTLVVVVAAVHQHVAESIGSLSRRPLPFGALKPQIIMPRSTGNPV
jgi:probable O-glycosylation ligase (exosortase A-associated)